MNYPLMRGHQVRPGTCGRTAENTRAAAFWQSRMVTGGRIPAPPVLTDLRQLAMAIRGPRG